MAYFPFFVDIEGASGLIVGGGRVATHKIYKLLPFKPHLKVVASSVSDDLLTYAANNDNIEIINREVIIDDVLGADFVIAASGDKEVNSWISKACQEHKIPVNVVDDKEKCSFIFPSLIQNGSLTLGVSTGGASPEIAAAIKNEALKFIPSEIDEILDYLSSIRTLAKEQISDDKSRAKFLKDTAKECMAKNGIFSSEETLLRIKMYQDNKNPQKGHVSKGHVSLVGAGCGGYDLVTLKGIQCIRNANVIIYDDLIDDRLLEFTSESCEKIYVGKRIGKHSMCQEDINKIIVDKANGGNYVVRLKGGDPFVFGRATEEMDILKENEIDYDYIPGITSAIAVPGLAGIPVTSRNISRSFHVITGHTSKTTDSLPEDLENLASLKGTLIFLMGLNNIDRITSALIDNGKDKDTPVAVIHADTDNKTQIIKSTLSSVTKDLADSNIASPAVIIIGDVVNIP
jgi:uroporphyrin-III C-methyltransferase/precorrin-2 dehydrogenase/sirohydrochlorin ferrochelatase